MIVETFTRNENPHPLVEKRDHSYDLRQIRSEVGYILRREQRFSSCPGRQLMLATVPGVVNPSHYGCGSAEDPFAQKSLVDANQFTEFNPYYRNYYLEKIWKSFPYKIGRMSLLVHPYYSCLSATQNGRDHMVMALETNKEVYHLYENHKKWYHIPCDEHLYYAKGNYKHTLFNGSEDIAVFLMFELL